MTVLLLALTFLQTPAPSPGQTVFAPGTGIVSPQLIQQVDPQYTPDAMLARKEGSVLLRGIVEPDGTVSSIRVVRPLDAELDREAIKAFEQWRFVPGTKDGRPVRVQISVALEFSVRGSSTRPVQVFRRTGSDGSATFYEIPDERFRQLTTWDPVALTLAPFSSAAAIFAAYTWLQKNEANFGSYVLMSVNLRRFPNQSSNRWFYQVEYVPAIRDAARTPAAPLVPLTAIVLFDGSIVEPKR
jgi:TonB family protein